jgi:uracil-DNA glycosylase
MSKPVNIEPEWATILHDYFSSEQFQKLADFVRDEYIKKTIYPKPQDIFKAFWLTPFSNVQVVILGQDPYHGTDQAHGLSFSVPENLKVPPSLQNIYKEIESDLGQKTINKNGNLENWAKQGVLMLNATLTVQAHMAGSHQNKGWEKFTDAVIKILSDQKENLVFVLWGSYAQKISSPFPSFSLQRILWIKTIFSNKCLFDF